jgi:hypothetical protein
MWILIVHEYVHILHLQRMGRFFRWVNLPTGRIVAPNTQLPRWFVEGLAVSWESRLSGRGRIRNPMFQGWMRAAAAEDSIPGLGVLNGIPTNWPQANQWYLFGAFFVHWLIDTHGWEPMQTFIDRYGQRLVPFGIQQLAREVWGRDLITLWDQWRTVEAARALGLATVHRARGDLPLEARTHQGFRHGELRTDPAGRCVWWLRDNGRQQIALQHECVDEAHAPVPTPHAVLPAHPGVASGHAASDVSNDPHPRPWVENSGEFDVIDEGRAVVLSQTILWRNGWVHRDLMRFDLTDLSWTRLTRGARAREPAVSPDGGSLVWVAPAQGRMEVWIARADGSEPRLLVPSRGGEQFSRPVWRRSGDRIVVGLMVPGHGRRLVEIPVDDAGDRAGWRWLTEPGVWASDPWISPDDRWLVHVSDRTGVPEAWLQDLEDVGCRQQLTRTLGGVQTPVVVEGGAGRWLYLSHYSARGWDIARRRLDALTCEPCRGPGVCPDGREVAAGGHGLAFEAGLYAPSMESGVRAARPARAWRRMRALRWQPTLSADGEDRLWGASLALADPPGIHSLQAAGQWAERQQAAVWLVQCETRALPLAVSVATSGRPVLRPNRRQVGGQNLASLEWERLASVGVRAPVPRFGMQHQVHAGWTAQRSGALRAEPPVLRPEDPVPVEPGFPRLDSIAFGWSWGDAAGAAQAIAPVRATSVSLSSRLRSESLGADASSAELNWALTWHRALRPLQRRYLSTRFVGGLARTRDLGRRLYAVGGVPAQDVLVALMEGLPAGQAHVRGYPVGLRAGDQYWLGQVEWRVALAELNRGVGTLPFFLERTTFAVFADGGDAWDGPWRLRRTLWSGGVELRLSTVLGYFEGASFRLGVARGGTREGVTQAWLLYGWAF